MKVEGTGRCCASLGVWSRPGVAHGVGEGGYRLSRHHICRYKASGPAVHSTYPLPAPFGFAAAGGELWPRQPCHGPSGWCSRLHRPVARAPDWAGLRGSWAAGRVWSASRPQAMAPEVSSFGVREGVSWVYQHAACGPPVRLCVSGWVCCFHLPRQIPSVSWGPWRTGLSCGPTWSLESPNQLPP